MTMLNTAIEYAKRGWAVFPLEYKGKKPVDIDGFHNATTDVEQITIWWTERPFANVGIATGAMSGGLAVIDIDIDDDQGKDGKESIRDWESKHGAFPETVCATTGRGGQHLYFHVDQAFSCARGIIPDVDIRCDGGYVVAPGSQHENGHLYEWDYSPDDYEIASANSSVLALLELASANTAKTSFKSPEKILAGARTETLFKLTASLQSKGLSDEAIKAAVRTENAEKCNPPLTDKELEKEVFGALSRYEKGTSAKTAAKKKEISPLVLHPANEIALMELDPITFHVRTILADGVTILSAKSKFYKSWFCLQLGIAVATGDRFLGYPTTKSDVLYLDLENDIRITKDRLKKVLNGAPAPKNLYIVNKVERMGSGFEEQLQGVLEEHPNIGVVIIDVLQYVKFNKSSYQTDYDADYRTFQYLKGVCKNKPLSIICVHHNRKMTDDTDPFANMLGSTALMGATDQEIVIHKKRRNDEFATISITGRTVQSIDLIGKFNQNTYQWECRGTEAEVYDDNLKAEYERKPLVKLIKLLLADQKEWQGTASELVLEAKKRGMDIGSESVVGRDMGDKSDLINQLSLYDGIQHTFKKKYKTHLFTTNFLGVEEDEKVVFEE